MRKPDTPENETKRLQEVHKLDILDTPGEAAFDDLTRLASMVCSTLFSTVTIVDQDRQWFKSAQGPLGIWETSRDISFCGHALMSENLFIVEDALTDDRFADNPLVTGGPMIRFYAGAPLKTRNGLVIGTLCVFDPKPGKLTDSQKEALVLLARQVEDKLACRVSEAIADNMGSILNISDSHIVLFDPVQETITYIDPGLREQLGDQFEKNSRALFTELFPDLPYDRFFARERMNDSELAMRRITRAALPGQPDARAELRLLNTREQDRHNRILLYRDKTELTKTRDTAREAEANLRVFYRLAMQSKNQFIVTDAKGKIEWVNASFEELTGYTKAEVIGRKPGDFLQGKDTSPLDRNRISRHLKSRMPVVQEILNYAKDGTPYWTELYIEPIFDESGVVTHFGATQTNVSRRKEENRILRQSRAEAERANRAKNQFLAKISHELRTPLNGIVGITEKLLNEVPPQLKDTVNTLDQSSQHLMALLNDLLDLSHIESGQLELRAVPFNLGSLLQDIEHLVLPRAQMVGNELSVSVSNDLPAILRGDETRLKQVLINLASNAVKFTREGSIRISAEKSNISCPETECRVRFSVADNGPGISPEHHSRIFESFEQLDNSSTRTVGGSGLGLAISRQLTETMGGRIALNSEPGMGSEFSFELAFPIDDAFESMDQNLAGSDPAPALDSAHVLVINDNQVNCTVLADLLRRFGIAKVYSALSAKRGLAILENIQPDLVFVDLQMPNMCGFEFLEYLQKVFSEQGRTLPPIIACTAEVSNNRRQECLKAGFTAHLAKPITGSSLRHLLTTLGVKVRINNKASGDKTAENPEIAAIAVPDKALLDPQALSEAFLDSEDLLHDFLTLLIEDLPGHTGRIREAIHTGTVTAHSEAAHSIKGLVGYFDSDFLNQQTSTLEAAMKAGEIKLARETFATVDSALDQIKSEAGKILSNLGKKQTL